MTGGDGVHEPNGLLAALVPFGVLRQPEVAVTTGIWWLLGLPGAARALDDLVARRGPRPLPGGQWRTEVAGDGGRTDLEYSWDEHGAAHVVVEAKLGHNLSSEQLLGYVGRVEAQAGLVAVLVPESRRAEAEVVVDRCPVDTAGQVAFDVWTYDEVLEALKQALPDSGDVAQLTNLVAAHSALDVRPFTPGQLNDDDPSRRDDLWRVLDAASFGLGGVRLPSGSDGSLQQRRYVAVGPYSIGLAVGIGRTPPSPNGPARPWAWMRIGGSDSYSLIAQQHLRDRFPAQVDRDPDGTWLPLTVTTGAYGSTVIDRLREEIEARVEEIRSAVDEAVQRQMAEVPAIDRAAAEAVLGLEPFTPEQLLDDCDDRRDDLWTLLREASRSHYPNGRLYPTLSSDEDFELVRYVPIPATSAHIALCLGLKGAGSEEGAQPWAWVRVNRVTPFADLGYQALETSVLTPVRPLSSGRAAPLDIRAGQDGPKMLLSIREQIGRVISGFSSLVARRSRS